MYQDIFHPINNETRKLIEDKVLDAFEAEQCRMESAGEEGFGEQEDTYYED
jgi:DNA-binding cell septation regulator SpoVG